MKVFRRLIAWLTGKPGQPRFSRRERRLAAAHGFLTPDSQNAIETTRRMFPQWFAFLTRCNALAMTLKPKLEPPCEDNQKLLEAVLYGRALQALQAAVLLAERGMEADARSALRNAVETAIFQLKTAKDAAFINEHISNEEHYARRQALSLLESSAALAHLSTAQIEAMRRKVAEIEARYPPKGFPPKINIRKAAESADALVLYTHFFAPMSNDGAHASLRSLNRHFVQLPDGRYRLRFGPTFDDTPETLSGIANVYLFVLASAISSFKVTEHDDEVAALHAEFKKMP